MKDTINFRNILFVIVVFSHFDYRLKFQIFLLLYLTLVFGTIRYHTSL